jgi:hypothetical protein
MGLCKSQRFYVGCRNLAPSAKIHRAEALPQSGDIHHVRFIAAADEDHRLRMHRRICTQGEKLGSAVLCTPLQTAEITVYLIDCQQLTRILGIKVGV